MLHAVRALLRTHQQAPPCPHPHPLQNPQLVPTGAAEGGAPSPLASPLFLLEPLLPTCSGACLYHTVPLLRIFNLSASPFLPEFTQLKKRNKLLSSFPLPGSPDFSSSSAFFLFSDSSQIPHTHARKHTLLPPALYLPLQLALTFLSAARLFSLSHRFGCRSSGLNGISAALGDPKYSFRPRVLWRVSPPLRCLQSAASDTAASDHGVLGFIRSAAAPRAWAAASDSLLTECTWPL